MKETSKLKEEGTKDDQMDEEETDCYQSKLDDMQEGDHEIQKPLFQIVSKHGSNIVIENRRQCNISLDLSELGITTPKLLDADSISPSTSYKLAPKCGLARVIRHNYVNSEDHLLKEIEANRILIECLQLEIIQEQDRLKRDKQQEAEALFLRKVEDEKNTEKLMRREKELKRQMKIVEEEKVSLIHARDEAINDISNVERAFKEFEGRYKRTKALLETMKFNESVLMEKDFASMEAIRTLQTQLQSFVDDSTMELERLHNEYENKVRSITAENNKLRNLIRKSDLKLETLNKDLALKLRDNDELNKLCDDLINST